MNLKEALLELKNGKAIKRIGEDKVYFTICSPNFEGYCIDDMEVAQYDANEFCNFYAGTTHFSEEDVFAEDWIVYERPRDLGPHEL